MRYGAFAHADGGVEAVKLGHVGLADGTFGTGPLGGTVREASSLDHALGELLREAGQEISGASLVVPDRWLRLLFTEAEDVARRDREEIWRWKLKTLVPFRVEDLRVRGVDVESVNDPEGGPRVLLSFAIEQLLAELEQAFDRQGVRIGQITSRSLSLMSMLAGRAENTVVAQVEDDGYSTFFLSSSAPVLVRYRAVALEPWSLEVEQNLLRDFRIIRSFLGENYPGVVFGDGLLCGRPAVADRWSRVLEESFEVPVRLLGKEDLPLSAAPADVDWHRLAPMVAAATEELA